MAAAHLGFYEDLDTMVYVGKRCVDRSMNQQMEPPGSWLKRASIPRAMP
jgi:hypothetical protein